MFPAEWTQKHTQIEHGPNVSFDILSKKNAYLGYFRPTTVWKVNVSRRACRLKAFLINRPTLNEITVSCMVFFCSTYRTSFQVYLPILITFTVVPPFCGFVHIVITFAALSSLHARIPFNLRVRSKDKLRNQHNEACSSVPLKSTSSMNAIKAYERQKTACVFGTDIF